MRTPKRFYYEKGTILAGGSGTELSPLPKLLVNG